MCLEDLQISRRKLTRYAPFPASGFPSKNPGTVTTLSGPLPDNGEITLIVGANPTRTALRVVAPPDAIFNSEASRWDFFTTLTLGFVVPSGTTDLRAINGPLYCMFALSADTKLFDTITIEQVGTLIYEPWGFIQLSGDISANPLGLTVWDIMIDREVVYQAQIAGMMAG